MRLYVCVCLCVAALIGSGAFHSSYAQVIIQERVEVQPGVAAEPAFSGIGFVAPSDGTLEIELTTAFRAGFELFTDVPDFALLQVSANEETLLLSDKIFSRSWDVVTVQNQVPCGSDVLPGQTYTFTGSETITVGEVQAGDEITLRFLTLFAQYGDLVDQQLDSSVINENGGEWTVDFIGNGRAEFINFLLQCTIPREELSLKVRYGSGTPRPQIAFFTEQPSSNQLEETTFLDIGHWESAYALNSDGSLLLIDGNPVVKNEDEDSFISADPDRFYVQVIDAEANMPDPEGNPVINFITIDLETERPDGTPDEGPQTVVLAEDSPDSGIFVSGPQLLVTQDTDLLPDDGFEANNQMGLWGQLYEDYAVDAGLPLAGTVADDEATDPTHKATVGGQVQVNYTDPMGGQYTETASVCNPDEIKHVRLNFFFISEPFVDGGFINSNGEYVAGVDGEFDWEGRDYSLGYGDAYTSYMANPNVPSEAYIDFSALPEERAGVVPKSGDEQRTGAAWGFIWSAFPVQEAMGKMASMWAQACVTFEYEIGSTDAFLGSKLGLLDGRLDLEEDLALLEAEFASQLNDDIIDVFVVGDNNLGYGGVAVSKEWAPGGDGVVNPGDIAYIVLSPMHEPSMAKREMLLAHDVGHILTNLPVPNSAAETPEYIFFPRWNLDDDDHYGKSRRITKDTEAALGQGENLLIHAQN